MTTIRAIQEAVSAEFGIPLLEMTSDRRARVVARPRQVAMYLSRELTPKSMPHIGRAFRKDHTTLIWACRRIESLMASDIEFGARVARLRGAIERLGDDA